MHDNKKKVFCCHISRRVYAKQYNRYHIPYIAFSSGSNSIYTWITDKVETKSKPKSHTLFTILLSCIYVWKRFYYILYLICNIIKSNYPQIRKEREREREKTEKNSYGYEFSISHISGWFLDKWSFRSIDTECLLSCFDISFASENGELWRREMCIKKTSLSNPNFNFGRHINASILYRSPSTTNCTFGHTLNNTGIGRNSCGYVHMALTCQPSLTNHSYFSFRYPVKMNVFCTAIIVYYTGWCCAPMYLY